MLRTTWGWVNVDLIFISDELLLTFGFDCLLDLYFSSPLSGLVHLSCDGVMMVWWFICVNMVFERTNAFFQQTSKLWWTNSAEIHVNVENKQKIKQRSFWDGCQNTLACGKMAVVQRLEVFICRTENVC